MMGLETTTETVPTCWLSMLVNDDASGATDAEEAACNAWADRMAADGWRVVSDVEGSDRFTWSYDFYGGDARGGDVSDVVLLREVRS